MNNTIYRDGVIDFQDIIRANRNSTQPHFFSPGATRFFSSRYPQTGIVRNNKAYFITSEQFDYESPRLYTVRVCDMKTGIVDTVGEFQQYRTRARAQSAINRIIKDAIEQELKAIDEAIRKFQMRQLGNSR